jgi:phage gp45-like
MRFSIPSVIKYPLLASVLVIAPQFSLAANPPADVVFIIDESGSMGDDQAAVKANVAFIAQQLTAALDPLYGLVGFGRSANSGAPVTLANITDLATFTTALNSLQVTGGTEPGVQATIYAMNNLTGYRPGAGVCAVLITDEDSDGGDVPTALTALGNRKATWFGIVTPNAGNTNATYGALANGTGGALFNILDFRANAQPVLNALLQKCIASIVQGIKLTPQEAFNPLGLNHVVTATIKDNTAAPVSGAQVSFTVTAGPNTGSTGTATTDANGVATFAYTSSSEGLDTIQACFVDQDQQTKCDTATKLWDSTRPTCQLVNVNPGPPVVLTAQAQDTLSGIASITPTITQNVTTSEPFTIGTTDPVVMTATKIDPTQKARVEWQIQDRAGNLVSCDPVVTLVIRDTGKPEEQVLSGIPGSESLVTVNNGTPGVTNLAVVVNGQKFQLAGLKDGETKTLDVSSAMVEDDNTIALTALGKPGGSMTVVISE